MRDAETLSPGRVFAGHEILREAGHGGAGIVYETINVRLRVRRALKVLSESVAPDPTSRARFERESRLAASLEHPNVVPIYEAGEADGLLYISMRFVDGGSLGETLAAEGPLAAGRVASIVNQVASALDAAHAGELIHRDVKPANILLERGSGSERAFLGDFGISRMLTAGQDLTETGEMIGTVNYVAPEQIAGERLDSRADVYSLACVAYEALTGAPPFERDTRLATMFAHANAPRPRASQLRRGLSSSVDRVLARGLAVDPAERPPTATGLAADLERALEGGRVRGRASRSARRTRAVAGVLGCAVAVVVGLLVFSSGGGSGDTASTPAPAPAPDATVVGTASVDTRPTAIAVGDLNAWTASASSHSVSAIVPRDAKAAQPPIPIDGTPSAIFVGFGYTWALDRDGGDVLRMQPDQGSAPLRYPVGKTPVALTGGPSNLWVVNQGDDTVTKVDPETGNGTSISVPSQPDAISIGEGGVWVASRGAGTLTELDAASGVRIGHPIPIGGHPAAVAAGEAGVWALVSKGDRVVRVSPGSRELSQSSLSGAPATALTTGYGYVWLARADGTVTRLDPTQLIQAGPAIQVGHDPVAITAVKNEVWTANHGDSTVTRIQPDTGD